MPASRRSRALPPGRALPAAEHHAIVAELSLPRRRATYADLLEVPEHLVAEIIEGELCTSPRPASPHALAAAMILADVGGPFGRPPGGAAGPRGGVESRRPATA